MPGNYKTPQLLHARPRRIIEGLSQYRQINSAPAYIVSRDGTFYLLERSSMSRPVRCDYLV
ncbi:MAG: hypothetical protein ACI9MZ_001406 [Porticoccaceae bacterium]|jgi:hypothetical protein